MSSPGTVMAGVNFEPWTGIDFFVGKAGGMQTGLAPGVNTTTILSTSGTVPTTQSFTCCRWFAGVGLDLHIFSSIFTGVFGGGGAQSGAGSGSGGGGKGKGGSSSGN